MVYELDGLQTGPIVVGEAGDSWLAVARSAIQERMAGEAIKFNLMAVIQDKRIRLRNEADNDPGAAVQLELEESKRAQWKLENQRRRHNYVPLCVAMLKELARMGKLPELVEQAKKRKRKNINA
jgi:ubiquitin carboxyl-terminal hydrolase L5